MGRGEFVDDATIAMLSQVYILGHVVLGDPGADDISRGFGVTISQDLGRSLIS
jgi:hypothetical protein